MTKADDAALEARWRARGWSVLPYLPAAPVDSADTYTTLQCGAFQLAVKNWPVFVKDWDGVSTPQFTDSQRERIELFLKRGY